MKPTQEINEKSVFNLLFIYNEWQKKQRADNLKTSQGAFADYIGITPQYLSKILHKKQGITKEMAIQIAEATGYRTSFILALDDYPTESEISNEIQQHCTRRVLYFNNLCAINSVYCLWNSDLDMYEVFVDGKKRKEILPDKYDEIQEGLDVIAESYIKAAFTV